MFSSCEDDLCIFVCGTCKRYFTQLSEFSQHKKEKLCKKSNGFQETWFANKISTLNHTTDGTPAEEIDSDVLDNQDIPDGSNEQLVSNDENDFNSQKRKYPRKQDKTKIKRTVRDDLGPVTRPLLRENGELAENENNQKISTITFPTFPFMTHVSNSNVFEKPSEDIGFCRHPAYVCKVCHMEFPNTTGKPYKCSHCRRGFLTERDLKVHAMRAKHDNLCDVCGKIFSDKYKLRKHTLSHVTEKNFPCDFPGCTKAFKSTEDVRTHVKYVHATEKPFKCTQCARAFSRPDKYKQHVLRHKKGTRFLGNAHLARAQEQSPMVNELSLAKPHSSFGGESSTCENNIQLSSNENTLKQSSGLDLGPTGENGHLMSSANEQATNLTSVSTVETSSLFDTCTTENNRIKVEDGVTSHPSNGHNQAASNTFPTSQLSPVDSSTVVTNEMENTSPVVATTYEPVSKQESDPSSKYGCHNCGLHFSDEQTLAEHSKIHTKVLVTNVKECPRCQTSFRTNGEFLAHEKRRPDQVLRCTYCSLKFLNICELRFHERESHYRVGELEAAAVEEPQPSNVAGQPQKHVCEECGKAFTRADKLRRHSIIHSPDRPCIPCACRESHDCPLTFYRKDSMKRHALTHTLEKPYKCDVCDKMFSRQDYVTKHISQVHKRVFKHLCVLCDYGTRELKRLKIHIRSRHEMDPNTLPPFCDQTEQDLKEETLTGADISPGDTSPSADKTSPVYPGTEAKVDLGDIEDSSPVPLSDTTEVLGVSGTDVDRRSEFVEQLSTGRPALASPISDNTFQHYSPMGTITPLNSVNFCSPNVEMIPNVEDHFYKGHQVLKNAHKTPLNSLTASSHQPGSLCGVNIIPGPSQNFFP